MASVRPTKAASASVDGSSEETIERLRREIRSLTRRLDEVAVLQKKSETALRASAARFRAATEAISSLVWTNDSNGEMEGDQPGWAAFTGQTLEEYQGYGWISAVHPDDALPTLEAWKRAVEERRMFVFEHRVRRSDGQYRLFSVRAVHILDESGSITEWVGVHTDITNERQFTETLRSSEARFRAMADSAPVLVWMADTRKEFTFFNRPWLQFRGRKLEQERGFGWTEGVHPDDVGNCLKIYEAAFDDRAQFQVEFRLRRSDGEWCWVLDRGVPLPGPSGEFTGYIGTCIDISDQKETEQALRENENRLRLAQSVAGIGTWDWNLKTGAVNWSPEIFVLLAVAPQEPASMEAWDARLHPEDRDRVTVAAAVAIRECAPLDTQFRIVRPDGEIRWLLSRASVVRDSAGEPARMLGINMDVTDSRRIQERTAFLVRLDDAARALTDPHEITRTAAGLLGEHLRVNRCAYADVEGDEDTFNLTGDYNLGVPSIVGRYTFTQFGAECLRLMRAGAPYVVEDAEKDFRTEAVRESYRATMIRSVICVPLHKKGRFVAAMAVHQTSPRRWRADEVELLQIVAARSWESIERSRVETELRRQRQSFDAVLSNTPDLICTFDLNGRLTYANAALLNVWEFSLPEVLGKDTFDLGYPAELAARIQSEVQAVIRTSTPVRNYTPFTSAAGETRAYEYIFSPVVSFQGFVEGVTCTARDMTERRLMEQQLAESKERLQQVFAQAPVAIVVLRGEDLLVELANPSYHNLVQRREILGRPLRQVIPDVGPDVWEALQRVLRTGEPFVASDLHIPFDADLDGEIEDHWFNVVYHPLREPDASVSRVVVVCSEVTAQVVARNDLQKVNRELEEFAYVASHDLQEPLRMIGIFSELLADFPSDRTKAQEYARFVREGVQRMEHLIRDLLSYSRVIHSEATAGDAADLNHALERAIETLAGRIEETGAEVTFSSLPVVRGDMTQFTLLFQNLLSNSIKYCAAIPRIDVTAVPDGDQWIIRLADNGIGFHQQYAKRIFGLFKRLHKDEYPGTGLGLAICQRIVERAGGRIWAEGREGGGAEFYIALRDAGDGAAETG